MNNSICIIGTGGFAREVLCLIDDLNLYSQFHAFMEPYDIWEKHWKDKTLMGKPVYLWLILNQIDIRQL